MSTGLDHPPPEDMEEHGVEKPPPNESCLGRGCRLLASHWKILLIGQILSLFLASTGAAQATMHLSCNLSAPTFTMTGYYLILAFIHQFLLHWREYKTKKQQRTATDLSSPTMTTSGGRKHWFGPYLRLQKPAWRYFFMALLDVEANAVTMLAFRYTTLTSVTLFDALAIPSAMILSRCALSRKYTWVHLLGLLTCMIGVVINITKDYQADVDTADLEGEGFTGSVKRIFERTIMAAYDAKNGDNNPNTNPDYDPYPHKILGDFLAILGGILYGINDTLTEITVRSNGDTVEYLGIVGTFGFFIALIQSLAYEYDSLIEFFGNDPDGSKTCSTDKGLALMLIFDVAAVAKYLGATRFLMLSEAAFYNLSLLTGDLWSVMFSIVAQGIVPGGIFFLALAFVLSGVVIYEMAPHPVGECDHEMETLNNNIQELAESDATNELELQSNRPID